MAPVMLANHFKKEFKIPIHYLYRLNNHQHYSGYDHLIIGARGKDFIQYFLIINKGIDYFVAAHWGNKNKKLIVTTPYKKSMTEEQIIKDRQNIESDIGYPIIKLSDDEFVELFEQIDKIINI